MCGIKLNKLIFFLFTICIHSNTSERQEGPDPWDYNSNKIQANINKFDVPPDLRVPIKRKVQSDNNHGIGEWFFRRTLAIILKEGQVKKNDDGVTDISLQMRFESRQWNTLEEYLKSEQPFSEDMLRRSLGFVENAIYKPTMVDQIAMAWNEHIYLYLEEYKTHITWALGLSATVGAILWLWSRISHRHLIIITFCILYFYEVLISYKEAEQEELDRFVSAMNTCRWYFWSSKCDVPPPDILIFMKHMNPLKIGIRMFTSLISEPMVTLSSVIEKMIHRITDELWFPLDKLVYGILIIFINISLIFFLISIIFNFILNIPFKLGFGFLNIGLGQRNRTLFTTHTTNEKPRDENNDRISAATLHKLLDVCSQALNTRGHELSQRAQLTFSNNSASNDNTVKIRRSASTGRLPNSNTLFNDQQAIRSGVIRRHIGTFELGHGGSGDAT